MARRTPRHTALDNPKIPWFGLVLSIQPRIRLTRSFDERTHSYLGYVLLLQGQIGEEEREFWIGVGKGAQAKHELQVGDRASGQGRPVSDPRMETAELYKISKLTPTERFAAAIMHSPPPWVGVPPTLEVYRKRGHRRLAARTYDTKCRGCLWGCRMPVEMIIDHWNPKQRRYRMETFCYGPTACRLYKAGPNRKVPGRRGMTYVEEDWIDEQVTAHRTPDE